MKTLLQILRHHILKMAEFYGGSITTMHLKPAEKNKCTFCGSQKFLIPVNGNDALHKVWGCRKCLHKLYKTEQKDPSPFDLSVVSGITRH